MTGSHTFVHEMDPLKALDLEVNRAASAGMPEPSAMTLATVTKDGAPRARIVLYKGQSDGGLCFFTNYNSDKAKELESGRTALLFHWAPLETQIRVEGLVEKVSRAESEAYFRTRPRISQLGAWSSNQSEEIPSTEYLINRFGEIEKEYEGKEVPCPPYWGGYRVRPLMMEFWFGRPGRMHERYVYERESIQQNTWRRYLKSP